MGKKRAATKYTAAGAVTLLYGAAVHNALSRKELTPERLEVAPEWVKKSMAAAHSPQRVAIVAATLTALTWTIALL